MKKYFLLPLMSSLFFMAADATAQEGWVGENCCNQEACCVDASNFYARVFGGANFLQSTEISKNKSTYDTGYVVAGSLGYAWRYGLRLEAEYAYRRNDLNKIDFFVEGYSKHGHYQSSSYMGNIIWDLPLCSWGCTIGSLQPYIGAGAGYDFQQMHATNSRFVFDQKWNHFSWQLMAGLAYPIFCNAKISLEYIFHQGGPHFNNHSVGVGLTYNFGSGI